jgi:hypothetical protein
LFFLSWHTGVVVVEIQIRGMREEEGEAVSMIFVDSPALPFMSFSTDAAGA